MEEENIKKEKIKSWFKDPYNLILVAILIFSFIILLYYFNLTKNQPLWYDEAEYMSTAKNWAFGIPFDLNPQRPFLFSFLAFLFYKIGFGEFIIRFFLEIIPSVLVVLFTYLLVLEMYNDKRIALITAFITSVSWINLFYAMRLMTDSLFFMFGLLAFYCFWKGYINNKGKIYIWLIGLFVSLSFLTRLIGVLYGVVILLFLILTLQLKFIKNKNMWISFFISVLTIIPLFIWDYIFFKNPLAFRSGYGGVTTSPLGWWMLFGYPGDRTQSLLYSYPEFIFFILFLVGLLTLIPMFLSIDRLILKKEKKYYPDLFMVLNIIFTLGFFIYFLRLVENRWLMMMSTSIFVISAKGIILIYDFSKKNIGKIIAALILILLLFFGAYYELKHANNIIKDKIPSYAPVKEASLWLKEKTNTNDSIVMASVTQATYYSERKIISFYNLKELKYYTPEEFTEVIQKNKPKYYVVSIFEPSIPEWTYSYPQNKSNFIPVKALFADKEQKQALLVIYEINYSN